jgi:hypothetical protein
MSGGGMRRALGEASSVRHHLFYGVKLDHWVFRRPSEGEASVFLVVDRVVAKAAGQDIPAGIFHVDLPSPPADHSSASHLYARSSTA